MSTTAVRPPLPGSLAANRVLGRWIGFHPDGTGGVRIGKIEIRQGILTALARIAADGLDIAQHPVRVVTASTGPAVRCILSA